MVLILSKHLSSQGQPQKSKFLIGPTTKRGGGVYTVQVVPQRKKTFFEALKMDDH